jgi:hypothetical protein
VSEPGVVGNVLFVDIPLPVKATFGISGEPKSPGRVGKYELEKRVENTQYTLLEK